MIIYEPITMLKPKESLLGRDCISKTGKHNLGKVIEESDTNWVIASGRGSAGMVGWGYYNWLAVFGYPKDFSVRSLLAMAKLETLKTLMVDYSPNNNQLVEII